MISMYGSFFSKRMAFSFRRDDESSDAVVIFETDILGLKGLNESVYDSLFEFHSVTSRLISRLAFSKSNRSCRPSKLESSVQRNAGRRD